MVALNPCAPFLPTYLAPFVRAYNTGAPFLSCSLSLAFLSELDNELREDADAREDVSTPLLNASKRFASAFSSRHVLNFPLPSLYFCPIFLVVALKPFVRAYKTGAPSLRRSLSLAFLSELVNELSLLLYPNLLATSRWSTPGAPTLRIPGSGDGDDNDDDVLLLLLPRDDDDVLLLLLPIDDDDVLLLLGSGDGGAVIDFPGHFFILRIVFHSQSPTIANGPTTIIFASCVLISHQSLIEESHKLYTMLVGFWLASKVRELNFVIIAIA